MTPIPLFSNLFAVAKTMPIIPDVVQCKATNPPRGRGSNNEPSRWHVFHPTPFPQHQLKLDAPES
jgi:hypothetical protein